MDAESVGKREGGFVNHVDNTFNLISVCSGTGMLDEGFSLACEYHGIRARTLAYVEREASSAAMLLARMEEESLEPAPVWCGSIEDIDVADLRHLGRVDGIIGGIPCQPFSVAGAKQGTEDARWLWPIVRTLATCTGAQWVMLENVGGFIRAGLEPILNDFSESGWTAEWLHLRASDVGASHQRERIFVMAHGPRELDNPTSPRRNRERIGTATDSEGGERVSGEGCETMEHPEFAERRTNNLTGNSGKPRENREREAPSGTTGRSEILEDAGRAGGRGTADTQGQSGQRASSDARGAEPELADTEHRERRGNGIAGEHEVGKAVTRGSEVVADASRTGQQGGQRNGAHDEQGSTARGPTGECSRPPIFAPGPGDFDGWGRIVADGSLDYLTPATEPGLRVLVDGLALVVDASRTDQLRAAGNGVVALQAAAAFAELFRRISK